MTAVQLVLADRPLIDSECPGGQHDFAGYDSCLWCEEPNPSLPPAPIVLHHRDNPSSSESAMAKSAIGERRSDRSPDRDDIPPHGLMACYDHELPLAPITELWGPGDTLESRYAARKHDVFVCPVGGCLSVVLWPEPTCGGAS